LAIFSFVSDRPYLHYNNLSLDRLSPLNAMSSHQPNLTRPHATEPQLTLDQQSFQELLSAAFTIQEHNDRRRRAQLAPVEVETDLDPEANTACPHCGSPKPAGDSRCPSCRLEELRPGERMQRNWASMWLMSQEQGLWPERSANVRETTQEGLEERTPNNLSPRNSMRRPLAPPVPDTASSGLLALPMARDGAVETFGPTIAKQAKPGTVRDHASDRMPLDQATKYSTRGHLLREDAAEEDATARDPRTEDADLAFQEFQLSVHEDSFRAETVFEDAPEALEVTPDLSADPNSADSNPATAGSLLHRLADWRVILRFHRADLYLGVAVCVAALALLWPAATLQRHPSLGLWDRTLIAMGIAEAPDPVVRLQGDPAIKVWIDPHSAVYYCPGEEQYGKTTDGRLTTQHEAQTDHFEPAGRDACE
jgi:hypothetical protein